MEMKEPIITNITQRTKSGEVAAGLTMTQTEFEEIVLKYGNGTGKFEKKDTDSAEKMREAQERALPGEEVKLRNFLAIREDAFERMVIALKYWSERALEEIMAHKKVRIVIDYNADELKTDFCIYTPKECEKSDMKLCKHMAEKPTKNEIGDYTCFCNFYQCPKNLSIGDCKDCKGFERSKSG